MHAGDVIAEIETDKATMEVEAVDEGKLARILVAEGTEGVAVNTPIAVLDRRRRETPTPSPAAAAAPRRPRRSAAGAGAGAPPPRPRRRPQPAPAEKDWGPTSAYHRARGAARRDGRWRCAPTSACS